MINEINSEKEELEKIKADPYNYICDFADSLYPKTGRKVFEVLSLMPVSLLIPDLPMDNKSVRSNIHCLFLAPSGGGKCLAKGTKILLSNGQTKEIENIEPGDNVITLNEENLKTGRSSILSKICQGKRETFKLKTKSGNEISTTNNHPFYTFSGWKELKDIKVGDKIAVPRRYDITPNSNISDSLIKIIAYLISDGHIGKKKIMFTNSKEIILQDFEDSLSLISDNLKAKRYKKGITSSLQISSKRYINTYHPASKNRLCRKRNDLQIILDNMGLTGKNSYDKFIPESFFSLDKFQTGLFLNRIFACDGCISYYKRKDRYRIHYYSNSFRLVQQLKFMLNRFGVLGIIRKKRVKLRGKTFNSYFLEIVNTEGMKRFIRLTGLIIGKEHRSLDILDLKEQTQNYFDNFPREMWENILEEKNQKKVQWNKITSKIKKNRGLGLNTKNKISIGDLRKLKLDIAKKYSNSDIFLDEVDSIESVGINEVYDLEIKDNHNFIANNTIVHNSSLARLFAGFTYNPLEIESITPAALERALSDNQITSLIVGDFARMGRDPILIKIIEGALGEEKRISRETMIKKIEADTECSALICGVAQDLHFYILSGLIFRTIPILLGHNFEEHAHIGAHIMDKIGNNGLVWDIKEKAIKNYYLELAKIQDEKNPHELQVTGYSINKEYKIKLLNTWKDMTGRIVKEIGFNWFREIHESMRILVAHAFLNVWKRKVEKGILYPNEEDFNVALRLMKRNIIFKYRLMKSESMARGIRNAMEFNKIIKSDNVPEEYKTILNNLVKFRNYNGKI